MTETEIKAIIIKIDAELESLITKVSYKTGEHEVKHNEKLSALLKLREYYEKLLQEKPCEEITVYEDF